MPDNTVYEVEISTQQRGLMNTRQKQREEKTVEVVLGCLDT